MMMMLQSLRDAGIAAAAATFAAFQDCNCRLYLYERFRFRHEHAAFADTSSVWIVGASSGIGREMARQLATQGHCPRLILSSRNEQALRDLANECAAESDNRCECICVPCNVTDRNSLEQAIQEVAMQHQDYPIDLVVLNAGAGQLCPALETEPDTVQQIFQTNALWPMVFMPMLLQSIIVDKGLHQQKSPESTKRIRSPQFLVTSSIAARLPVPLSSAYAASKAALQHYFGSLSTERPDLSIDIVCPGPVDTHFHSNHVKGSNSTATRQRRRTDTKDDAPDATAVTKPSPLKMPVECCVRLMLAAVAMRRRNNNGGDDDSSTPPPRGGLREYWIAQLPVLVSLYLNQWFPTFITNRILARIGTRRVQMWRDGLDLYDPDSWKKATTRKTNNERAAQQQER